MNILKIALFSLVLIATNAQSKAQQENINARCYLWGSLSGVNRIEFEKHLSAAMSKLSERQVALEIGYASGFVTALHYATKVSKKELAHKLYNKSCLATV